MIVWWALALAPGCNQILGLDQPADDDDDDDARDHDARVIDGPADRDMDGIVDGADLCPDVADPGQYDEDGDGTGDRCDLCPHLDQADDTDDDEDGIHDACDPYPGMSSGVLRFSGFHTGDEIDQWLVTGSGVATVVSDALYLQPNLDAEMRATRIEDDSAAALTRVIAEVELEPPNAGSIARRAIGAITNVNTTTGATFFLCQIETDLPISSVRLQEYRIDGPAATIATATIATALPVGPVQLDFDIGYDPPQVGYGARCSLAVGSATNVLPRTTTIELAPGKSGVRTYGVPMRVNWVVLISHPG